MLVVDTNGLLTWPITFNLSPLPYVLDHLSEQEKGKKREDEQKLSKTDEQ